MAESQMMSPEHKRDLVCEALAAAKAVDLVVLDVHEVTILADYFVMGTGTSSLHIAAIGSSVREHMKRTHGINCQPEGDRESNWVILDYGDLVVHLFSDEMRSLYGLEKLWHTAKQHRWEDPAAAVEPAEQPS
ncbi:MAG: ribosome silencing factor [Armatimonadetes bacterium]|nr:ribosome silencing factor [Armatimonadota bacterium]NCO93541.1 ribosome silencing factor [Armatimonadota bacterium]NCP31421.1 ribosome silencing factor [Armatimonadota bacterium]NCQ26588.1 ribosome silencing factor [Armatimonadota bacterium]NDK14271.1 ribosome silencing factor [Armatimonadota bacterium]